MLCDDFVEKCRGKTNILQWKNITSKESIHRTQKKGKIAHEGDHSKGRRGGRHQIRLRNRLSRDQQTGIWNFRNHRGIAE